jgi:hypothetical protein
MRAWIIDSLNSIHSITVMTKNSKLSLHALFGIVIAGAFAGCGGGGGGDPTPQTDTLGGTSAATEQSAPVTVSNATQQVFIDGVYHLIAANYFDNDGYGAEFRKTSIPSTTAAGVDVTPATSHYAGAQTPFTNFIFDEAEFEVLSTTGWKSGFESRQNGDVLNFGPENEATLSSPALSGANRVPLALSATTADATGTDIEAYLDTIDSTSSRPEASGTFSRGAKFVSFSYRALADAIKLSAASSPSFPKSLDSLIKAGALCYSNVKTGKHLVVQFDAAGNTDLYDTSAQTKKCDRISPEMDIAKIGTGTYVQAWLGDIKFLTLDFPTGFDFASYNGRVPAEQLDAGIKEMVVDAIGNEPSISFALHIPAGTIFHAQTKFLNKDAADQVKAALKLQ